MKASTGILLQWRDHQGILQLVCDLNALYQSQPALHQVDFEWQGYEWLELHDWENSVIAFLRRAKNPDDSIVVVCNFTPVVREHYRIGVPSGGILPRDPQHRLRDLRRVERRQLRGAWGVPEPYAGRPFQLSLRLPPLGVLYLKTPVAS